MKRSIYPLALLLILSLSACYSGSPSDSKTWQIAYKHDRDGKPLKGSKEKLFAAIRAGKSVRIGWGWYNEKRDISIEHLADPVWLAIIDQKEVMAHLEPQILAAINWDDASTSYEDSTLLDKEWRVVINTNGSFDAVWYSRKEEKVTRRAPQKQVLTWFVNELAPGNTKALFETK